jgi:hypothetical protein
MRNTARPGRFRLSSRISLESNRVPLFLLPFDIDHLVGYFRLFYSSLLIRDFGKNFWKLKA